MDWPINDLSAIDIIVAANRETDQAALYIAAP